MHHREIKIDPSLNAFTICGIHENDLSGRKVGSCLVKEQIHFPFGATKSLVPPQATPIIPTLLFELTRRDQKYDIVNKIIPSDSQQLQPIVMRDNSRIFTKKQMLTRSLQNYSYKKKFIRKDKNDKDEITKIIETRFCKNIQIPTT